MYETLLTLHQLSAAITFITVVTFSAWPVAARERAARAPRLNDYGDKDRALEAAGLRE